MTFATERRGLLLVLVPADHPHRDPACATLAWIAAETGLLLECYHDGRRTGAHYGGGHLDDASRADLRGGLVTGGHHLEELALVLQRFDCRVVSLGAGALLEPLRDAGVPVLACTPVVAEVYREVLAALGVAWPDRLLVVGRAVRDGARLAPYAFPEVVHRRLLAIGEGDGEALRSLLAERPGLQVETLWLEDDPPEGAEALAPGPAPSLADSTLWMADRWAAEGRGFLLGDDELVGRWLPTAARSGWLPLHGVPQAGVVERAADRLRAVDVVVGRQQDDRDFMALSRLGTAFALVDPGRPPFPVLREVHWTWPQRARTPQPDPDDAELDRWAAEGRVPCTLLFWTGMPRELENLYALADVLALTRLRAGLVVTAESFAFMSRPPLSLVEIDEELGGLAPNVELLLASAGAGALVEAEAPLERFAATLARSVASLAERLGSRDAVPRGWWGVMDAPLVWKGTRRIATRGRPPFVSVRYRPRPLQRREPSEAEAPPRPGRDLRARVRASPLGSVLERLRPFDGYRPGPPCADVLGAVRDAGFTYAFTKAGFGGPPRVVSGVDGLTALTYTAGRWDGWTPFCTVNDLGDLRRAERRLLRAGGAGWLAGTIDACLWALSGPRIDRASELRAMCDWIAAGGASGRLVSATPHTVARFAEMLARTGRVTRLAAR